MTHLDIKDVDLTGTTQDMVGTAAVEDTSEEAEGSNNVPLPAELSKRQKKKLAKRDKWLQYKSIKRVAAKARKKEQMKQARERGEDVGPSRKKLKRNKMSASSCKLRVAIDCSFDPLMTEKDIYQLVQQLQHCYGANRRVANPLQMYVTSTTDKTYERLESIGNYKGWDVYFRTEPYEKAFKKEEIVYLTSDSPNVLTALSDDKVYIIGGLVDHNKHKGLCYKLALEKGIAHSRLPIGDFLDMKTRSVLTINHVFEILLRFTETKDWEKAFCDVIPKRKGAVAKSSAVSDKDGCGLQTQASSDNRTLVNSDSSTKEPSLEGRGMMLIDDSSQSSPEQMFSHRKHDNRLDCLAENKDVPIVIQTEMMDNDVVKQKASIPEENHCTSTPLAGDLTCTDSPASMPRSGLAHGCDTEGQQLFIHTVEDK